MMKTLDRFPQIGTIEDYMELPPGDKALYEQYTLDTLAAEARTPVLKFSR